MTDGSPTADAGPDATGVVDAVNADVPVDAASVDAATVDAASGDAAPADGDAAAVAAEMGEAVAGDVDTAAVEAGAANTPATEGGAPDAASGMQAEASAESVQDAAPFVVEEWVLSAIEALVFAAADPLSPARAKDIIAAEMDAMEDMADKPRPDTADMKAAFRTLIERWGDPTRPVAHGFRLIEVDGGLCVRTAASNARFIRRMQLGKPQRLSRASLETLAVIAYRQPVTKPQIEEVRGVDSGGALKALLDKKLVRVLGKADEIGRPLLYGTTKTFLEFFHLANLNDLPTLKELHELESGVAEAPKVDDERPAMVMDLFNPNEVGHIVSEETERESQDALDALERALGEAKDVAKKASTLVFGVQVEDDDPGAPPQKAEGEPAPPKRARKAAAKAAEDAIPETVEPTAEPASAAAQADEPTTDEALN